MVESAETAQGLGRSGHNYHKYSALSAAEKETLMAIMHRILSDHEVRILIVPFQYSSGHALHAAQFALVDTISHNNHSQV